MGYKRATFLGMVQTRDAVARARVKRASMDVLERLAGERGVSVSVVIREALAEYVDTRLNGQKNRAPAAQTDNGSGAVEHRPAGDEMDGIA